MAHHAHLCTQTHRRQSRIINKFITNSRAGCCEQTAVHTNKDKGQTKGTGGATKRCTGTVQYTVFTWHCPVTIYYPYLSREVTKLHQLYQGKSLHLVRLTASLPKQHLRHLKLNRFRGFFADTKPTHAADHETAVCNEEINPSFQLCVSSIHTNWVWAGRKQIWWVEGRYSGVFRLALSYYVGWGEQLLLTSVSSIISIVFMILYILKYNFTKQILNMKFFYFIKWARLNSLVGRFWPVGCMFDNPGLYSLW